MSRTVRLCTNWLQKRDCPAIRGSGNQVHREGYLVLFAVPSYWIREGVAANHTSP
jgi:hypothetical protein